MLLVVLAIFMLFYPRLVDSYFLHLTVGDFPGHDYGQQLGYPGETGQVLGRAGRLFGIGAYAAALLYQKIHLHPILGMLAGATLSMIVAIGHRVSDPSASGIYFSITTIAFARLCRYLLMTREYRRRHGCFHSAPFWRQSGNMPTISF